MNELQKSFLDDLGAVFRKHNVRLAEPVNDDYIRFEFSDERGTVKFIAYYGSEHGEEFKGVTAPFNYQPEVIS